MRYLITHSLLSSWVWAMKDNPYEDATTETDKTEDFLKSLNREPIKRTPAMQNGIDFEDLVAEITTGKGNPSHKWYEAAKEIVGIVGHNSPLQYRAMKEVTVGKHNLLLYGRLDALRAGVVYDIKFSGSYERGNFVDSTQHPMYMELVPEAKRFDYVVSNGKVVWTESYTRDDTPSINPIIESFLAWLQVHDLMHIYQEKWQSK